MGVNHVFIRGSKGIPAKYGGFETFVEKLTEYQKNKEINPVCLRKSAKIDKKNKNQIPGPTIHQDSD